MQYQKQIKQKYFFDVFLIFFAIAPNGSPFSYAIQSEKEARCMSQKMCSKESTYSREALQGIKNHYMEEEDPWRHFFLEMNNYIHEKIIWI